MGLRVLSREEIDALTPDAVDFIYNSIMGHSCSPDVIEETLMQAVLISRFQHCKLDADVISFLIERISENGDSPMYGIHDDEPDPSSKFC